MVGLGRFLGLFTAWYHDGGLFKLYTARSCPWRIMGTMSIRQGTEHDRWHVPYSTGWEVWMFSTSFSFGIVFGIVRLSHGLSGPAAVKCNECTMSVRVIHFGLFAHHLDSLYIQQGPAQLWIMMNVNDKKSGGWFHPKWELHWIIASLLWNDIFHVINLNLPYTLTFQQAGPQVSPHSLNMRLTLIPLILSNQWDTRKAYRSSLISEILYYIA